MRALWVTLGVFALAASGADAADIDLSRLRETAEKLSGSQSIWKKADDGSFIHLQTELRCPAATGPFEFDGTFASDTFGRDVGCNYENKNIGRISLFLTKRDGETIDANFRDGAAAIEAVEKNAVPMSTEAQKSFTSDPNWRMTQYEASSGRTGMWMTDYSGWTFEFRATYFSAHEEETFAALSELADAAQKSAATHLAACVQAPPLERSGERISEKDVVMIASLTIILAMNVKADDGADPKVAIDGPTAPVWCMEDVESLEDHPYIFWRNIAANGMRGATDRISVAALDIVPAVEVLSNPVVTDFSREKGGIGQDKQVYAIVLRESDTFRIFAYFVERPDGKTLAALANEIFLNKRQAIGVVDKKSGKITIIKPQ